MTTERPLPVFAIIYAASFAVVYLFAVESNWALFTYHPALEEFGWLVEKPRDGPAMYWYGWLATGAIGALVIAAPLSWLPASITGRIAPFWSWLIPVLIMLAFAYVLRSFFIR